MEYKREELIALMREMEKQIALCHIRPQLAGAIADEMERSEPVVHGRMRIEFTTDDFVNRELASNGGWYRKRYFCPFCGQKLKEETYEKEHCFASWDLVREECSLHYCPNCGAHMKDGE